jgi:hypothetical protein
MRKIIRSFSSASATAGLAALLFLGGAGAAGAQTSAELQAQITALLAQISALQTQLGTSSVSASAFTRDLTLGATGSDVTALQNFLIGKGFTIPAGATGYFGAQTAAALSSYQAARGITPSAGYFGAITRARVAAETPSAPSSGDSSSSGSGSTGSLTALKGGEATIRGYKLTTGDDLSEGDTGVEIATAKFDVRGGDIEVQRVKLELTSGNASLNTQPWRYLKSLSLYDGGTKIGSVSVDGRDAWDKSDTTYSVTVPVNDIVKEGDTAELSIRATAQSTIDSANQDQTFSIVIPDNGIRAVDATGIQQYAGNDGTHVTLAFNGDENGNLTVRLASDTPDSGVLVADTDRSSDTFRVLSFEVKNKDAADAMLNQLTFRVDAAFAGSSVSGEDVADLIRKATLTLDGKTYQGTVSSADSGAYEGSIVFKKMDATLRGNATKDGVLTVVLSGSRSHYDPGATLSFALLSADVDAEGAKSGDKSDVSGSALGNVMTVSTNVGISVAGKSNATTLTYNSNNPSSSYGTFTLKFAVTATGDDVYVPKTVAIDSASSTYAGVHIVNTGDSFSGTAIANLTSTAKSYNDDFYVVNDGDTETFTVSATLNPDAAGAYQLGLDSVQYSATSTDLNSLQILDTDQNKAQFRTDPLYIPD